MTALHLVPVSPAVAIGIPVGLGCGCGFVSGFWIVGCECSGDVVEAGDFLCLGADSGCERGDTAS